MMALRKPLPALLIALTVTIAGQAAPDPDTIVQRADDIRFPPDGFQVDVVITTTQSDGDESTHKYRVLSQSNEKSLVMTTYPPTEKGQILLMKGHDLWAYMPDVSQPVRLPLAQRLTGQVANGDLARADFAGDYEAELLGTETIDGERYYKLNLEARSEAVTYRQVKYWVNADNFRPLKAEFYTVSGRLFKTCSYEGYKQQEGAMRPTRLVMKDALRSQERSVLEYHNMEARQVADKVFTKNYLKKLQ